MNIKVESTQKLTSLEMQEVERSQEDLVTKILTFNKFPLETKT